MAISVMWKEFGIRLNFTPTVNGDRVHLKVKPEVSTLDFNNSVVLQGFRIPALSTRRADTEIELQDRQTFAIAGLLNNTALQSMQKVAGLGDIPILGYLFKSKAAQKDQTELVVMITPEILAPNSFGVTPSLPKLTEPYLGLPKADKVFPQPPPAFQQSTPAPPGGTAPGGTASVPSPSGAPAPAVPSSAAADISPRTKEEQKKLRRQQSEARERELEQQKRDAKVAEKQSQKDREENERHDKLAHEQAKRDEEVAKKAAEVAKRQAEIDRERQKEVDAAAAKLKAAEDAYQAELAKRANTHHRHPVRTSR